MKRFTALIMALLAVLCACGHASPERTEQTSVTEQTEPETTGKE